jgi:hypothetical protein
VPSSRSNAAMTALATASTLMAEVGDVFDHAAGVLGWDVACAS